MSITGMRTQEALGLQWQDVDFEGSKINIKRGITKKIERDSHGAKVSSKTVVGRTKTGASKREIEVPAAVIELLQKWREKAPTISQIKLGKTDFVFGNTKGPSWTYGGFRSSVNHTLNAEGEGKTNPEEEAVIKQFHLHRLRHTVATKLSDEPGATVFQIMQLMGHTEIKTAQGYINQATKKRGARNKEFMEHITIQNKLLSGK